MPIKETVSHDIFNSKAKKDSPKDPNPLMSQIGFFARMFENYLSEDFENRGTNKTSHFKGDGVMSEELKELIYKTYAKSIDQAKSLQSKEKKKMKKIMNLLIYLQMKKIELKLNYFNDFDKLVHFNKQQIKTVQSQHFSDRVNLAINKIEVQNLSNKLKENLKHYSEFNDVCQNMSNGMGIADKFLTRSEMKDVKILEI